MRGARRGLGFILRCERRVLNCLRWMFKKDVTVAEVVRVFREERNIDGEKEVAVFNGSGDEITQSVTFYTVEFFF